MKTSQNVECRITDDVKHAHSHDVNFTMLKIHAGHKFMYEGKLDPIKLLRLHHVFLSYIAIKMFIVTAQEDNGSQHCNVIKLLLSG